MAFTSQDFHQNDANVIHNQAQHRSVDPNNEKFTLTNSSALEEMFSTELDQGLLNLKEFVLSDNDDNERLNF